MAAISRFNPFGDDISLECPISLKKSNIPSDGLHSFAYTFCNQARLRVRCWDLICTDLANMRERPDWMTEAGRIRFQDFVATHQHQITQDEAASIGPNAAESYRLLTEGGNAGFLNFDGLHGGETSAMKQHVAVNGTCHECRANITAIYQSQYLNRYLRLGEFEYTWRNRVQDLTMKLKDIVRPFQELWGGYVANAPIQELQAYWNSCFRSIDQFVRYGEKVLLSVLGMEVALKVFFVGCRFIGFKGIDPFLKQIDQQIDNWMNMFSIPLLTWEFLRQTEVNELKLISILIGCGFLYLFIKKSPHVL